MLNGVVLSPAFVRVRIQTGGTACDQDSRSGASEREGAVDKPQVEIKAHRAQRLRAVRVFMSIGTGCWMISLKKSSPSSNLAVPQRPARRACVGVPPELGAVGHVGRNSRGSLRRAHP